MSSTMPFDRFDAPVTLISSRIDHQMNVIVSFRELLEKLNPRPDGQAEQLALARQTDKKTYDALKARLPAFLLGRFSNRLDADILNTSGLFCYDIDLKDKSYNAPVLAQIKASTVVLAAWPSPSYCGYRVVVADEQFLQMAGRFSGAELAALHVRRFKENLNLLQTQIVIPETFGKIDGSCCNAARFFYLAPLASPDDLYVNKHASDIRTAIPNISITPKPAKAPAIKQQQQQRSDLAQTLKKYADQHGDFTEGRHNYLIHYCHKAVELGIGKEELQALTAPFIQPDFQTSEINGIIDHCLKSAGKPQVLKKNKFNDVIEFLLERYEFKLNTVNHTLYYKDVASDHFSEVNEANFRFQLMSEGFTGIDQIVNTIFSSDVIVKKFNPFDEYFKSLQWDGRDHLQQLFSYIKAENEAFFQFHFTQALKRTCALALHLIPFNKQCLALLGRQNDGKTSLIRFLTPHALRDYQKENFSFEDKDGRLAIAQNLIINLDELSLFKRADLETLKACLTQTSVKERLPYTRSPVTLRRCASFWATTNKQDILSDDTGNVRWIVAKINQINHNFGNPGGYAADIDTNQIWAQIYHYVKAGDYGVLTDEQIDEIEENNEEYFKTFTELEYLQNLYRRAAPGEPAALFIQQKDIKSRINDPRATLEGVGRALNKLNIPRVRYFHPQRKITLWGYWVKPVNAEEIMLFQHQRE